MRENRDVLSFWDQVTSTNTVLFDAIYFPTCSTTSFLLLVEWNSIVLIATLSVLVCEQSSNKHGCAKISVVRCRVFWEYGRDGMPGLYDSSILIFEPPPY